MTAVDEDEAVLEDGARTCVDAGGTDHGLGGHAHRLPRRMTTVVGDRVEVPEAGSGDAPETPAQKTPGRGRVGIPFQHQPERSQRQPRCDVAIVQREVPNK